MSARNPKVDAVAGNARQWREETEKLRAIILDFDLKEDLKWGKPCYSFEEHNVVLIQGFKEYCALLFTKGVLLKDPKGALKTIGQNTQAARQLRFANLREVIAMAPVVKAYIREAIEVEKAGVQVTYKKTEDFPVPDELRRKLKEAPALKTAFAALTPGRQRGYLLYFSQAKQSKTREARIEKCAPQILQGKGLNDD